MLDAKWIGVANVLDWGNRGKRGIEGDCQAYGLRLGR
jgi:hypothetical protein